MLFYLLYVFMDLWFTVYGPVRNAFDACISITRASGRELGPGNRDFGPYETAWSRQANAIRGLRFCTFRHFPAFSCTVLHFLPLSCTFLLWTALSCTVLHCLELSCIFLYCQAFSCSELHSPALSCFFCTFRHFPAMSCTVLHFPALSCTVCIFLLWTAPCTILHCPAFFCPWPRQLFKNIFLILGFILLSSIFLDKGGKLKFFFLSSSLLFQHWNPIFPAVLRIYFPVRYILSAIL